MGNVGVVGCRPRPTRAVEMWLFSDQRFFPDSPGDLSTGLFAYKERLEIMTNLWISLWLNSGKNALDGVIAGFWLSAGFPLVAPFWGGCMWGVSRSSQKHLSLRSIPCESRL